MRIAAGLGVIRAGAILLACALAAAAGEAPPMPDWLTPMAGAQIRSGSMTGWRWSRYLVKAAPDEVIEHYRGLFERAGLAFHPVKNTMTTTIRGAASECSLEIEVQGMLNGNTSVSVNCRAWEQGSKNLEGQAKYDRPVYPKARAVLPPLEWPAWLVTCDGPAVEAHRGIDQFKVRYIQAEFVSHMDREAILDFYDDLMTANDYKRFSRSSKITPRDRAAVVEGWHFFDANPGPRFAIRVQVIPASGGMRVQLRISAHP
jgi:hypothetical protein